MNKPKILFVIDKPNWAYDQMANFIIKELSYKYDFYKEYQIIKPSTIKSKIYYLKFLFEKYRLRRINDKYDLVVYLWWWSPQLIENIVSNKKLIGIFTEGFPPGNNQAIQGLKPQDFINKYLKPTDGIIAGNRNIEKFYGNFDVPVYYATGSTDTNLFKYNKKRRKDDSLRVCWTGNPNRNFKGFFDFVVPAVKLAQKQRPNIKLITRFSGPIKTLPEFYSNVDVMVNASVADAGPGFILDAGACGIPTITLYEGVATEHIRDYDTGLIVKNRNINEFADKIIELYDNRELLEKMSKNISKEIIEKRNHQIRSKYWDEMFQKVLNNE